MEENRDVLCVGSQRRPSACFGAACRENGRRGCSGGEVSAPCKKWVRTEKQALLILSGWDAPIVVKEEERWDVRWLCVKNRRNVAPFTRGKLKMTQGCWLGIEKEGWFVRENQGKAETSAWGGEVGSAAEKENRVSGFK